ncbi:hypothetical protein L7F22_061551, partial [Adiantum nelumboides]|nr:hypothetical protein [Adiantum nelumboides]
GLAGGGHALFRYSLRGPGVGGSRGGAVTGWSDGAARLEVGYAAVVDRGGSGGERPGREDCPIPFLSCRHPNVFKKWERALLLPPFGEGKDCQNSWSLHAWR